MPRGPPNAPRSPGPVSRRRVAGLSQPAFCAARLREVLGETSCLQSDVGSLGRPPALHSRPTAGACPAGGDTGSFWGCPTGQRVVGGDTARRCWGSPPAGPEPSLGAQLGGAVPCRAAQRHARPSGSLTPPQGLCGPGFGVPTAFSRSGCPHHSADWGHHLSEAPQRGFTQEGSSCFIGRRTIPDPAAPALQGSGRGGCWRLTRAMASLPSADCARCSPGAADRRDHSSEEAPHGWALVSKRTSLTGLILGEDAAFRTGLLVSLLPQKGPSSKHRRWAQVPVCSWSCGFGHGQQGSASVAGELSMPGGGRESGAVVWGADGGHFAGATPSLGVRRGGGRSAWPGRGAGWRAAGRVPTSPLPTAQGSCWPARGLLGCFTG